MTVTVTEPVPAGLQRQLRAAVLGHVRDEPRRARFPATLRAGTPERRVVTLDLGTEAPWAPGDHALHTDMVSAMLARGREPGTVPLVWFVRPGPLEEHASDLAWHRATASAGAELGLAVRMVVVVRHGWRDPRSGVHRRWARLRERGAGRPGQD